MDRRPLRVPRLTAPGAGRGALATERRRRRRGCAGRAGRGDRGQRSGSRPARTGDLYRGRTAGEGQGGRRAREDALRSRAAVGGRAGRVHPGLPRDGIAFKATAGLHHAVRTERRSTASSTCSPPPSSATRRALAEDDAGAFALDETFRWRDRTRRRSRSRHARELFVSFGSCSFIEPVEELKALGFCERGYGIFNRARRAPRAGVPSGRVRPRPLRPDPGVDPRRLLARGRSWRRTRRLRRRRAASRSEADESLPLAGSTSHLPFEVADYVDFYSSLEHATNLGKLFRPGLRAAAAELAPPADRLPRPRRHGRRQRHADRPPERPAQAARRGRAGLRPHAAARHRARARLRDRARPARTASRSPVDRSARPRLRRRARQRLERARHPGLGVPAARPVPRQVVRHLDLRRG